jgi:hypothetical protein
VLEYFPQLRLCLSGFGGNSEWQCAGWFDNGSSDVNELVPTRQWLRCIIKLTAKYENVYADLSGLNIYDDKVRSGLLEMLRLIQDEKNEEFKHLKNKLIFGSGWYLTSLTDVSKGGRSVGDRVPISHTYSNYCREFKTLFSIADMEVNGTLWERVSLINAWNFYGFDDRVGKIHDELVKNADGIVDTELLKKMNGAFDGSEWVAGLVEYIKDRNCEDIVCELRVPDEGDLDLVPYEQKVLDDDKITHVYWSYGDEHTPLENRLVKSENDIDWPSKYYNELNLHIETEEDNDGKVVELALNFDDDLKINLRGSVSGNKVMFEKVFEKYMGYPNNSYEFSPLEIKSKQNDTKYVFEPLGIIGDPNYTSYQFEPSNVAAEDITGDFVSRMRAAGKYMKEIKNNKTLSKVAALVLNTLLYHVLRKKLYNLSVDEIKQVLNAENETELNAKALTFDHFYKRVKTNGPWDLKNAEDGYKKYQKTGVIIAGKWCNVDVPGNVMYGYAGTMAGFSKDILLKMAGLAQKHSDKDDGKEPKYTLKSNWDDPRDQIQIKAGIALYEKSQRNENLLNANLIEEVFDEYEIK